MPKEPQRMCVSCRTMKDKRELIKIVFKDGAAAVDRSYKGSGRGAYVCRSAACIAKSKKTRAFHRAFKTDIGDKIYTELEAALEQ